MNINATLFGQALALVVFVLFCMKYVWPPLIQAIEDRQKIISEGLTQTERATKNIALAEEKSKENLKEAKNQAADIIDQANKRHSQIVEQAKLDAESERNKIIAQGRVEIESEISRVKEELRLKVSTLAIQGAEKIIKRSIDIDINRDIIDKLTTDL